ncbi:MAG: hypothetical protein EXR49_02750 [Dehalococcoidia bacterium]|nr:hypothetical protein [Dehalococcoidia bacterium]
MRFAFTPEQEVFRQEVRAFLARELPKDQPENPEAEGQWVNRAFSKKLAARGWIGLAWPKEHGGQGLGYIERFIYNDEMIHYRAPIGYHQSAERQMGPSIMLNGSDYQKKHYLPGIVKADLAICIGYSEPNAGSDLAGVQTTAVRDGDDFLINGEKTYTTNAHVAEYVWLATRTNPNVAKHKGISVFIVDLRSPGVDIQPLYTMAGTRFNIVRFNNVRVPRRELVGELDGGWYIVAQNLDFERSGIERVTGALLLFEDVVRYARETRRNGRFLYDNPVVRNRIADMSVAFAVGRQLAFRVAWMQSQGKVPNHEASISKGYGTELTQRAARLAMDIMGMYGPIQGEGRWTQLRGRVAYTFLVTVSETIRGGTSEIQRNIIATRGLRLPR